MLSITNKVELSVDDVIRAWTQQVDKKLAEDAAAMERSVYLTDQVLQLLAEGQPVSAAKLAGKMKRSFTEIESVFHALQKQGAEFDENGHLVGAALTLKPTPHRFRVNGRTLYTWCALDAMFLPGFLGKTAEVESACPVTGDLIQLTIAPEGVIRYAPAEMVLSITVPGLSCKRGVSPNPETGPQSEGCSQMHFFSSPQAAKQWLVDRLGIAIFSVADAYRLAYANWISRRESVGHTEDESVVINQERSCCC